MAIVAYTKQDDYDVVNDNQDCIGWMVADQSGNDFGKVTEMLVNTETDMVDSIIVDGRKRIPASDIALRDGRVFVRGVLHEEEYKQAQSTMTETSETNQSYAAVQSATGAKHVAGVTRAANEGEVVLPIIEEQLRLGKRTVEKGAAQVRTSVAEVPVQDSVTLREENVTVERRPVDRAVENAPAAFKEGTIEVTEMAEVPVVSKEAHVVEEVVVGKNVTEHQETVRDTIRRTEVDVDEVNRTDNVNQIDNRNRQNS
ncbi:MAG: YsnF/AvaK domain-containing protein [Acidobacteriota bacterium]|nr:YsnF/AvaK domain-containing protein [Acidobacteriota bacterium]